MSFDKYGKLLRVDQVAKRFDCSPSTVYRMIDEGKLPRITIGAKKGYRVPEAFVEKYMVEQCAGFQLEE